MGFFGGLKSFAGATVNTLSNGSELLLHAAIQMERGSKVILSIKAQDMEKLQTLRYEQGILGDAASWDDIFKLVDPPFAGLLRFYKAEGAVKPEIGDEVIDQAGSVIAEVEVAWPTARLAVVKEHSAIALLKGLGWKVETLESALQKFRS